jgi:large subunit ribosomal protein L15
MIHNLSRKHPNKKAVQIGRGGKRGKTSGSGHKGQKARAGHRIRPEIRDLIKKLPKLRGRGASSFKSIVQKAGVVNVSDLVRVGSPEITPASLVKARLIRRVSGKIPPVKVLGTGEIDIKVSVSGCLVSAVAREKIEKAGGSIA